MIRRGNSNKQTSVVNAPIQNDTLTGREGIVRTSAPENLNAVYESTNFEVDLSGQLTTRKALRPCSGEFRSGIQLFDGYMLTKDPSSGEYAVKSNADASYSGAVAVAYVDYVTSEEAPGTTLNALSGALDLTAARCEASGSIAYLSNIGVYTSKWTPTTKPFPSDVSGRVARLATLRKSEGSESKWILRIVTPEVVVPEDASDGNGFDPNLYGDNPYAMRDAYNYGSTAVRGIVSYKVHSTTRTQPKSISYAKSVNSVDALFHCIVGTGALLVYANHTFSEFLPSQIRKGSDVANKRIRIYFECTYKNGNVVKYTHTAPLLYVPKGAVLAQFELSSVDISTITARFDISVDSDKTSICVIPDDSDVVQCSDDATLRVSVPHAKNIIGRTPSAEEGYDFESMLDLFGLCVTADDSSYNITSRVPSWRLDMRALDLTYLYIYTNTGNAEVSAKRYVVRHNANVETFPNYATCQIGALASTSWDYAYSYAKNTSVRQLTEFAHAYGYGMLDSISAADFTKEDDVLVLKAAMTFSNTPQTTYVYWERSHDGVTWEPVPSFLQKMSKPGLLRYIRVTDATASAENLDSADTYVKYVLACPLSTGLSADDTLLDRPDVLVFASKDVPSAIQYKYRVTCVAVSNLDGVSISKGDAFTQQVWRDFGNGVHAPVPNYKEGPVVYLDDAFPTAKLSVFYQNKEQSSVWVYSDDLTKRASVRSNIPEISHTVRLTDADFMRTARLWALRASDSETYAFPLEITVMHVLKNALTLNAYPILTAECTGASSGGHATLNYKYAATVRNRTELPVRLNNIHWDGDVVNFDTYAADSDVYGFGYDAYGIAPTEVPSTTLTLGAEGTSDVTDVVLEHTFNSHVSANAYSTSINPIESVMEIVKYDRLLCRASEEGSLVITCNASYTIGTGASGESLTVTSFTLNTAVHHNVHVSVHGCSTYESYVEQLPIYESSEYYKTYIPGRALENVNIWQPTQTSATFGPHTFNLAIKTETLSTSSLNIGSYKLLEHNEVFLAYGGDAKNKVYVSEAGTMIFPNSLAIESRSGADVTGLLKWRSHVIMTTESSIELLTYDSETGTYAVRTLSATMGVSEDDANALQALPNSFILRSGSAVYSMSPSMYSGSDELLYTNLVSAKLGDVLSDKPAVCSWLDHSANAYHMLCKGNVDYVYDYARKLWWINVYTPSVKGVSYISGDPYLACGFTDDTFGTVLYKYDTSLYGSGDGRYVDTYWEGTDSSPRIAEARIPLSVTWKDRCSKPTLDKQWLELKYTVARHNGLKHISDECAIGVGGETLTRTLDPNTSMPFAAAEDAYANGLGVLSANAFQTGGKTAGGNMDQMFVKFSGRGKTATLTIEPTSDDRITLHSAELRWRTLPNKQ